MFPFEIQYFLISLSEAGATLDSFRDQNVSIFEIKLNTCFNQQSNPIAEPLSAQAPSGPKTLRFHEPYIDGFRELRGVLEC